MFGTIECLSIRINSINDYRYLVKLAMGSPDVPRKTKLAWLMTIKERYRMCKYWGTYN